MNLSEANELYKQIKRWRGRKERKNDDAHNIAIKQKRK